MSMNENCLCVLDSKTAKVSVSGVGLGLDHAAGLGLGLGLPGLDNISDKLVDTAQR